MIIYVVVRRRSVLAEVICNNLLGFVQMVKAIRERSLESGVIRSKRHVLGGGFWPDYTDQRLQRVQRGHLYEHLRKLPNFYSHVSRSLKNGDFVPTGKLIRIVAKFDQIIMTRL